MTADDYDFTPSTWTMPAGDEVRLNLENEGTVENEWVLLKEGMSVTIPFDADDESKVFWEKEAEPGQTETGVFTAPTEPGSYQVVCGIPGHLEEGMQGMLTVK